MRKWIPTLLVIGAAFVAGAAAYHFKEEFGNIWGSIRSLWANAPSLPDIKIPMPKWPFG
jgi:hypothetical protein